MASTPLHCLMLRPALDKPARLFVREIGHPTEHAARGALVLGPGEGIASDTYFGTFPLGQWKRLAQLRDVHLVIRGEGRCRCSIRTLSDDRTRDSELLAATLDLDGDRVLDLSGPLAATDAEGIYLEVIAEAPLELEAVSFVTNEAPRRQVGLGLVITTFGRAEIVSATLRRLAAFVGSAPESALGSLSLIAVDNGRELDPQRFPGTVVLPNPNLGGAGGFARGLSYLLDRPAMTHACFMDDDAETLPECLLRIHRLLAFAEDDDLAISGTMLLSEAPHLVHEQGALFDWDRSPPIVSRKQGLDLLRRADLARMLVPEPFRYGGWWLFSFPIRRELRFPYPFFVRGDDWLFGYANAFRLETLAGVASWQPDFGAKIGPLEQYLSLKAFLVFELMMREPPRRLRTLCFFGNWILRNVASYCYDRAHCSCEAVADVLRGPAFWAANVNLEARLSQLRASLRSELLAALPDTGEPFPAREEEGESRMRRLMRLVTLNGILLPRSLFAPLYRPARSVPLRQAPQPRSAFLADEILYYDDASPHGRAVDSGPIPGTRAFVARRDLRRSIGLACRAVVLLWRLFFSYHRLRRAYVHSQAEYCTREWWNAAIDRMAAARPDR